MKALRNIIQLLGMIFLIGVTFWFGHEWSLLAHDYPEPFTPPIMSITELQTSLVNAGYDIGPCGIDGRLADCNTVQAWERWEKDVLFNQYAAKFFTPSGRPKDE